MKTQLTALAALAVTLLAAGCGQPAQTKTPTDTDYRPVTAQDLATASEAPVAVMRQGQHQPVTASELSSTQAPSNPIYAPVDADELANANVNSGH